MSDRTPGDGPSLEMPSLSLRRRRKAREAGRPRLTLTGLPAVVATGAVVGGLAVLVAWLAGLGCSAARGTSSCGGAAGLPILLVALAGLAWAGAVLLRHFAVGDPGSTSLLAVGLLAVLVMVLLLGSLDEWWSAVAVPIASLVSYAASWWVTTTVADGAPVADPPETHDVR